MLINIIAVLIVAILAYFVFMAVMGNKLGFFFSGTPDKKAKGAGFNNVENIFFTTVFSLLGYVARRDGPVNDKEMGRAETFMKTMHLDEKQRQEATHLFMRGASPNFDVSHAVRDFKGLAQKSANLTQILLVYLVSLARVDGLLVSKEIAAVQEIAAALGYSSITFEQLLKMLASQERFREETDFAQEDTQRAYRESRDREHQNRETRDEENIHEKTDGWNQNKRSYKGFLSETERSHCAYDALGLTPQASDNEVRKAYQKLASQFHPDKLIGQGLPPFMVKALTERFKYIQSAYDCIKKEKAA